MLAFIALDAAIVAMAVFYGGAAQIIAGIFEWRKNNTFASTAFISYGSFWLTIAGIIVFPKLGLADKPSGTTMAAYLGLWGLISFILFIGTLRLNRALQVVFFLLWVAFALLALGDLTGIPSADEAWWVGRHRAWVCGDVYRPCASFERSLRAGCLAAGARSEVIK